MGNKGNKKVIKAALFGSVTGAVMGLLLAPKSGQELRQDLAEQTHELGEKAVEIRGKAQNALHNVEEKTQVTFNTGKNWIQKRKRFFDNLKTLVYELQHGALSKRDSANSLEDKSSDHTEEVIEGSTEEKPLVETIEDTIETTVIDTEEF